MFMGIHQQNRVQGGLAVPVWASAEQPFPASHRPFSAPCLSVSALKGHKAASKGQCKAVQPCEGYVVSEYWCVHERVCDTPGLDLRFVVICNNDKILRTQH